MKLKTISTCLNCFHYYYQYKNMKPPIFSCLTSRVTNTGSLYGRFLFGPLPIDISLTVATILRRSLLHTKNPFAIVSAEIEGATHEYASLEGVQESVLEILLNLGDIVLASKGQNLLHSESQSFSSKKVASESLEISDPSIPNRKNSNLALGSLALLPFNTLKGNDFGYGSQTLSKAPKEEDSKKRFETFGLSSQPFSGSLEGEQRESEKSSQSLLGDQSFVSTAAKNLSSLRTKDQRDFDEKSFGQNANVQINQGLPRPQSSSFTTQSEEVPPNNGNTGVIASERNTDHSEISTAFLRISGPCIVTAKDIHWPKGIYCVKPKTYIATLSSNNTLALRIKIISYNEKQKGLASITKETNQFSVFSKNSKTSSDKISTEKTKKEEKAKKTNFFFFTPMSEKTSRENTNFNEEASTENQSETYNFFGETSRNVLPKWGNLKLPFQYESIVQVKKTILETKQQTTDSQMSSLTVSKSNAKSNSNESSSLVVTSPGTKKQKTSLSPQRQNKNFLKRKISKISTLDSTKPWGIELPVSTSSYPVEKVNFLIERDDQLGGYRHRIILEIWTNGSISPRQAIFNSIGWIIKLLYNFREPARISKTISK